MKEVLPCDVTKANLLLPDDIGQFDVVTSQLVLETGCQTTDAYSAAVKNISQLLRPSGRLLLVAVLECTYYVVDGKAYSDLPLTKAYIEEVLALHNFYNISSETTEITSCMEDNQLQKFLIFHAVNAIC